MIDRPTLFTRERSEAQRTRDGAREEERGRAGERGRERGAPAEGGARWGLLRRDLRFTRARRGAVAHARSSFVLAAALVSHGPAARSADGLGRGARYELTEARR